MDDQIIDVIEENTEQNISVDEENVVVNQGGTTDHARLRHLDYEESGHTGFASSNDIENIETELDNKANISDLSEVATSGSYNSVSDKPSINGYTLSGNKLSSDLGLQALLQSGTNIKTINNESLLGGGNIDIEGGYPDLPEDMYSLYDLLEIYSDETTMPDGIYRVTQDWYIDVPKQDTYGSDSIFANSLLYVNRFNNIIAWSGPSSSTYWYGGDDTFYGGILTTTDDVDFIVDEKLGSNIVTTDTDQDIPGKKTFTNADGTVFQNAGGLIIKYLSSSPEFKIIPDNNGNFNIYYQNTQLGRIDAYNSIMYRGVRPNLTETVDIGTSNYKFNNVYAKTLYGDNVPKEVSKLITNDNNILPETGGILSLGNSTYRWNSLYLGTNINFNPQQTTRIENLKTLSVNTIKLGQQQGSTTTWIDNNFLQVDAEDIKCVGKLLGGLNVNNMVIHNIPNLPDDGTSPINKNYADNNLQEKLTFDSTPTDGSTNPVTSDGVFEAIQNVTEVAEGKTATYTLSYATTGNTDFNSQDASITVSSFVDTAGNTITDADVKVGDIVLVVETDVPDRWVQAIDTTNHTITLYKMETSKIDLTNYVDLTSAQTISGEKTITSAVPLKFAGTYTGQIINQENQLRFKYGESDKLKISTANITSSAHVIPNNGNTFDLGTSTYKWRNVYIGGNLSDGTNSVAVNKIANKDNFVTLTQAEYDALATKDPDTFYFIEEA